ncbi:hypothetical protein TNCV_2889001 [Trichonephila clavipes]|nr:hypothetical protein TNCV_2889001 [Trichonephila clavipes]
MDDRWQHHRSPPPQFRHGTEGEGNILRAPCTRNSAHKIFGPTDLTSTYSVCPSGLESDALTTRVPTAFELYHLL